MSRIAVVLAVLALAVLTACGSSDSSGSSASDKGATTNAKTTATAPEATATAPASTAAPATAATPATTKPPPTAAENAKVVAACHKTFDPFIAQLRKINNDLADKPEYKRYRAATRKMTSRYRHLRSDAIPSSSCQHDVSVTIASAYFTHLSSVYSWTECRKRNACGEVMVMLKKQWRSARRITRDASKAFDTVTAA